jgi:hypothetical protein
MGYGLHQLYGLAMTDSVRAPQAHAAFERPITWRSRYDGLVEIAYLENKAVAGISGPWDGKFALTWWDRPMPARQLELYDSLDDAKFEIESWALRMRDGAAVTPPRDAVHDDRVTRLRVATGVPLDAAAARHVGLVERMFNLWPAVAKPRETAAETIERLRRERSDEDDELADLHFSARR